MSPAPHPFDEWYRRNRPKLLRLAASRLRDLDEAEDVVQETALAVWRRHEAGGVENLDAYASRAVWQNAIKRSTRRRRFETLEDAALEGAGIPAVAEAWMETLELEQRISRLPLAQQTVLRLRFYAGLSFRETAEALSISLNTAASRCRYAIEALREGLTESKEEDHEGPGSDQEGRTPARTEFRRRRGGGHRGRD